MTDQRQPESADQVEDLDVPAEDVDAVKGGIQDGTSNTVTFGEAAANPSPTLDRYCASGKHIPKATLN